jgi:hypothetical protein
MPLTTQQIIDLARQQAGLAPTTPGLSPTGTPTIGTENTPPGQQVPLSSTPTPTGTPTDTPTDPNAGMENRTGFASRYTPYGATLAYENPWYILPEVFPGMRGGTANPFFQGLRDLPFDPLALYTIAQSSQPGAAVGASPYINWLEQMYRQQLTPGGAGPDAKSLIRTVFGQGAPGEEGANNTLQAMLAAGGPSEQIRVLFNLLRDASAAGMNPLEARAYQSAVSQAGDRYGSAMMKADETGVMGPTEWIRENAPWLAMG